MNCFEGIDLSRLFDSESEYGKNYLKNEPLDETPTGEGGLANYVKPEKPEKKTSFLGKLFRH